jgi:putative tricarboxylic transport membrane protein
MTRKLKLSTLTALLLVPLAIACTGCGASSGSASSGSAPVPKQFLVDDGAGGGSDLFAREIEKVLNDNHLAKANWPVQAMTEGSGLGLMGYLKSHKGAADELSTFTSKWMVEAQSTKNAPATIHDTTPIAELVNETQLVAVSASSGITSLKQLFAAAKAHPGNFTLVGGSNQSVGTIAAVALQKYSDTQWKYLFFDDEGSRIAALLRGDAQVMIDSTSAFAGEVKAGKIRIIATLGTSRLPAFPDAPTLRQAGVNIPGLPDQLQFRGVAGPADMPASAVKYWQNLFAKMAKTKEWKKYVADQGDQSEFITGAKLQQLINGFAKQMSPLISSLPS